MASQGHIYGLCSILVELSMPSGYRYVPIRGTRTWIFVLLRSLLPFPLEFLLVHLLLCLRLDSNLGHFDQMLHH